MVRPLAIAQQLIEPGRRARWILVVLVAAVVSALEALGAILVFVLLSLITSADEGLRVPFLGDLRTRFPGRSDTTLVTWTALSIGAFFVIRAVVSVGHAYAQHRVAHHAGVALSRRLLDNYLRLPYSWHLRRNSAELIRNAYESVSQIVAYVFLPAVALVSEGLVVLAMLAVLLLKSPAPTAAAIGVVGVTVLVLVRLVQPRLGSLGVVDQEGAALSVKALQQSLAGVREIKLLGREGYFVDEFARVRATQARASYLRGTFIALPRIAIETVALLFILGFLVVSSDSEDSLAVLGLFAYAVLRVLPAINRMVANLNTLRFGRASVENVTRDLQEIESLARRPPQPDAPAIVLGDRIALHDVTFSYGDDTPPVVQHVSLNIRAATWVGFVGPTGGGKTTIVDLILGLLTPTSGKVLVDGHDVAEIAAGWHRLLGVVPQEPFLIDDAIRRNVALGVPDDEIDEAQLHEAIELAQLAAVVAELPAGLDTLVGERGVRLSGGQRQRVAIARALYRRPDVLVFDEGTSALDMITEADLIHALECLRAHMTIITVAHRLSTVRRADELFLIRDGKIADHGTYEQLVDRNDEFRRMAG